MYWLNDFLYVALFNTMEVGLFGARLWRKWLGRRPAWPPRRVLLIHTEGIGNLVMSTPLIAALRRAWPAAELIVAVSSRRRARSLLDGTGLVNRTVELPDDDGLRAIAHRQFWADLGRQPLDLAVLCFPFSRRWKLAFLRLLARLGCHGAALRFGPTDFLNWSDWIQFYAPVPRAAHEVEINLTIARHLAIPVPERPRTVVGLTDADRAFADRFIESHALSRISPLIGLHPGSLAASSYKRWPTEKHVELARRLHENSHSGFVVFEGPDDADAVAPLDRALGSIPHAVVEGATLGQTAAAIARCHVMVATDSALGHLAAALDVPTVTIFGPGDPQRVRPWGEKVKVVRGQCPRAPCIRLWRPVVCQYNWRCLTELPVDDVFQAASELLSPIIAAK